MVYTYSTKTCREKQIPSLCHYSLVKKHTRTTSTSHQKRPISFDDHNHLAQKVASDPSSSKETWDVEETPPTVWTWTYMFLLVGFFDDQRCVCLMIKHHPEKNKCCLEKSFLFLKSPPLRGNSWNFVTKQLVTFRKIPQKKRPNRGCPNAQWDLWRCHPTQFWRKDVTASPRIPPKHPKTLPDILSHL